LAADSETELFGFAVSGQPRASLSSVVAAEMRAIELDALHGGIGCGLGGA